MGIMWEISNIQSNKAADSFLISSPLDASQKSKM